MAHEIDVDLVLEFFHVKVFRICKIVKLLSPGIEEDTVDIWILLHRAVTTIV